MSKYVFFIFFVLMAKNVFAKDDGVISFDQCNISYNNQAIRLDWNVDQYVNVLGEPDYFREYKNGDGGYYTWEKLGVAVEIYYVNGEVKNILKINLDKKSYDTYRWYRDERNMTVAQIYEQTSNRGDAYPVNGFYFNGVLFPPEIGYKDFLGKLGLTLDQLGVEEYALNRRLVDRFINYKCEDEEFEYISYEIGQPDYWTYKGAGHLMFTDKYIELGNGLIKDIYVFYPDEKPFGVVNGESLKDLRKKNEVKTAAKSEPKISLDFFILPEIRMAKYELSQNDEMSEEDVNAALVDKGIYFLNAFRSKAKSAAKEEGKVFNKDFLKKIGYSGSDLELILKESEYTSEDVKRFLE
jgi:hypothetical protein